MTTFSFKPGASQPLVIQPEQDDGTIADLTGSAMQLRVFNGSTCVTLTGVLVVEDDLFEVNLNSLTLPPRLYPASIYIDWGDGWIKEGEINLLIEGGC